MPKKCCIQITEGDIDRAKEAYTEDKIPRCMCCPIAQAIKRLTGATWISVSPNNASYTTKQGKSVVLELFEEAGHFVLRFDTAFEYAQGRHVRHEDYPMPTIIHTHIMDGKPVFPKPPTTKEKQP